MVKEMTTAQTKATAHEVMNRINKRVFRFDKHWTLVSFFFSWVACLITPICIGIVQSYDLKDHVVQVCIFCDVYFIVKTNKARVLAVIYSFCHQVSRSIKKRGKVSYKHETKHRRGFFHSPFESSQLSQRDDPNSRRSRFWPFIRAFLPVMGPMLAKLLGASELIQVWLTLPRMIRLRDLASIYFSLKYMFVDLAALHNDTINRCIMTAVGTSIYASTLAAFWFYMSCQRLHQCSSTDDFVEMKSWVGRDDVLRESDSFSIYIRSMHFVIQTLFTVGYGDIDIVTNQEYAFALFLILNGSLYYAFLISSITSLMSNKDVATKMYRSDLANVRSLLQLRDAPESLRVRINQFFQFSLARQCGCSEQIFLNDIPVFLLQEIKQSYATQLKNLPFFAQQSDSFIELCVERLTFRTYVPGSVVFFQNERRHREVILIKTGKIDLSVNSAKGTLFTYIAGDSFGDFQLIFGNLSEVTAKASTFTEVVVLSLPSFSDAIRVYNLDSDVSADVWLARQVTALSSTIDAHKSNLAKFLKVRATIQESTRSKRISDMMDEMLPMQLPKNIVPPDSIFRPIWAAVTLIGMAYFILAIPLRILVYVECPMHNTVELCLSSWDSSLIVDYMWDVVFIVDMILHSFFFAFKIFENDEHILVSDWRHICRNFWRSRTAYLSILATFPFDLLALRWGYLLCFRVSKLLWVGLIFDKIYIILHYYEHDSAKKQALLSTEGITVVYLSIFTFIVMLWTAVAWAVLRLETDESGTIASVYFAMTTMTTVGFGDIFPETNMETLFVVIFCIIGPSCSATIIANAASFLNATNVSVDNIGHRRVVIKAFLASVMHDLDNGKDKTALSPFGMDGSRTGSRFGQRIHPSDSKSSRPPARNSIGPPPTGPAPMLSRATPQDKSFRGIAVMKSVGSWIQQSYRKPLILLSDSALKYAQVVAYLDYVENEKRGLDEEKLMSTLLPDYMQSSLQQAKVMDSILNSKFYAKCNSSFVRDIMLALEVRFVPRNSIFISVGSAMSGSYIIQAGTVQIYTERGQKNQKLVAGDSFGEIHVLEDEGSKFKAEALSDCELLLLRRFRFQMLVREHGRHHLDSAIEHMRAVAQFASRTIATNKPQIIPRSSSIGFKDASDNIYINPKSTEYLCWVILLSVLTLVNIMIIPPRFAFMEGHENTFSYFMLFDYGCDLCYLADIVLRSNYLILYEGQGAVFSREKIRNHYWNSWQFKVHLIAAFPLDIIFIIIGRRLLISELHLAIQQAIALYRFNKLLRCVDLTAYFSLIEEKLARYFSNLLKLCIRVGNLVFAVLILAHVFGCMFFFIGNVQHMHGLEQNWADDVGILRSCSLGGQTDQQLNKCDGPPSLYRVINQYIFSIYWATATLTTVGFGDIAAVSGIEQTYAILLFLVGTAAYTVIVTNLEDIVSHLDVTSYIFKNRMLRLQNFLHRERATEGTIRKNTLYHDKLWLLCKGAQGKEVKDFLPTNIYSEVISTVVGSKLNNLFFLRDQSSEFILDIAARMILQVYLRADCLFHSNEAATKLYIMNSGDVSMLNESSGLKYEKVYCGEDAHLGSSEFFLRQVYACTAQAATDVVTFELSFADFWEKVELHRLDDAFLQQSFAEREELHQTSTQRLVDKFSSLITPNRKMAMHMGTHSKINLLQHTSSIQPDSWIFRGWNILCVVFVVYISMTVPYFIAFHEMNIALVACDCILFAFLAADMYLRFKFFAVVENGDIITDQKKFSRIYIDNHLQWDLVSMLPIAVLVYASTGSDVLYTVLRSLYMCRLRRVNSQVDFLMNLLSEVTSKLLSLSPDKFRVVKIITMVCYLSHVTCCVMCLIGLSAHDRGDRNWIDENGYEGLPNLSIYIRSYFWAFYTMVTVGFGSIQIVTKVEKIFAIGAMIVGAIMCDAGVTAMLSSIIANADVLSGVTRRSKEAMLQFVRSHGYDDEIVKNVVLYYDYLSSNLQNSVELRDFQLLPLPLQLEFVEFHSFESLCSLCLLDTDKQDTQLGFVYSILRHVKPTIAIPGQVILPIGGLDVHVLRRGKAYARMAGQKTSQPAPGRRRDYYQVGEALCREGKLAASSPGKLVTITLRGLESVIAPKANLHNKPSQRRSFNRLLSDGGRALSGLATNLVPYQPSLVHARLSCGAKKRSSSHKSFTMTSSYDGEMINSVKWREDFTFHVPKSAVSLKIMFFDDKQSEDDGYIGKAEVIFDEMEDKADFKTIIKSEADLEKDKEKQKAQDTKLETGRVARVLQRLYSSIVGNDVKEIKHEEAVVDPGNNNVTKVDLEKEKEEQKAQDTKFETGRVGRVLQRLYSSIVGDDGKEIKDEEAGVDLGNNSITKDDGKRVKRTARSSSATASTVGETEISNSATSTENTIDQGNAVKYEEDADELVSFDDNSDDDIKTSTVSPQQEPLYMYHIREEVKNIHDKVQGMADVQISIKGSTVTDYTIGNNAKMFERNRQLSTTPTEAVAESFCHLFSLSWEKLTEVRAFYEEAAKPVIPPSLNTSLKGDDTVFQNKSSPARRTRLTTIESTDDIEHRDSDDESDEIVNKSESQKEAVVHNPKRRKSRPSFTSALHDNHDLRRMACNNIASSDSEDKTAEMESDPLANYLAPKRDKDHHHRLRVSVSPALPDCKESDEDNTTARKRTISESEEDRTTNRRRMSDNEMEKVFGVAELAQKLRKNYASEMNLNTEDETTIERHKVRMNWS